MKKLILLSALCALPLSAQVVSHSCDSTVFVNPSSLITASQGNQIDTAARQLASKGADPRVVIDDTVSMTPEQYVSYMQRQCPSWQSANGGVKNNLTVFIVFPSHHKLGLFLGREYSKAIKADVIRSQFMTPAFRDHDWSRGMVQGINQTAVEVEAFQEAPLHPAAVINQATDFSGLWKWLDGILILIGLIGAWGLFVYYRNRRIARRDAQQRAVQARNDAAKQVTSCPDSPYAEEFARLSSSETYNPDTNGMTVEQYNYIARKYIDITMSAVNQASPRKKKRHDSPTDPYRSNGWTAAPAEPGKVVENHTTIINESYSSPSYIPVPIIVEEPYVAPYREPEPYRAPDPTPSSGWSDNSSSSSFDSGSSSSWSDSSSSSDYSSGGSSDFGGSSSDF